MNVWELIGRSYVLPFHRLGDMWRVFWPAAFVWAAFALGSEYVFREVLDPKAMAKLASEPSNDVAQRLFLIFGVLYVVVMIFVFVYTTVFASGLVRWHRFLIKDDAPTRARLWLGKDEWAFLWRWTWLGLLFVAFGIVAYVLFFVTIACGAGPDLLVNLQKLEAEAFAPGGLALTLSWTFVVAMGLAGRFFPRTFLSLAALAVGEGEEYRRASKKAITSADCSALALAIVASTAPFLLLGIGGPVMMAPEDPDALIAPLTPLYVGVTVAANILNFVAIVVFATMLSLFYRQRFVMVRVGAGAPATDQAVSAP